MDALTTHKAIYREYLDGVRRARSIAHDRSLNAFFAPDAKINVVHPFNECAGTADYSQRVLSAIGSAFTDVTRSDYIAFGGAFEGHDWVTSTGYYTGEFQAPFLGIAPTGEMAHLRFGEFHRMNDGRAVESYIYLDIPELMIAANAWPINDSPGATRGFTGYLNGPTTCDGLQWGENDPIHSASSCDLVTTMLHGLATEDEAWRPFWNDDMVWYGPGAFGSFYGIEGFARFQVPFEQTFSEWIGGAVPGSQTKHFTRFADGDYVCSGGWPSLNAVQVNPFLGQPATGKRLFMRVCDWWRREGDKLAENWVFVDVPHVLLQMGFDVFADLEMEAA